MKIKQYMSKEFNDITPIIGLYIPVNTVFLSLVNFNHLSKLIRFEKFNSGSAPEY
tara:strand:- start:298 stop:462 length:165 start_codon:yes stop_codon:yes gene_type:complete